MCMCLFDFAKGSVILFLALSLSLPFSLKFRNMGLGGLLLPNLNVMVSGVTHSKIPCMFSSLHSLMSMLLGRYQEGCYRCWVTQKDQ